jgi:hypothetical protein
MQGTRCEGGGPKKENEGAAIREIVAVVVIGIRPARITD